MMTTILVPTSPGDLIDKITILELKADKFTAVQKLEHVRHELSVLQAIAVRALPDLAALHDLQAALREVNADLWSIEDDLRLCETRNDFGPGFIALARAVYITNDKRADIKKEINLLLGSDLIEEKVYGDQEGRS